jgi:hypothetical protein
MDANVTIVQAVTLAIALLGAVLGVINTWFTVDRSRVKLKVLPAHCIPFGGLDPSLQFTIAVTNLSEFAVTIVEVGVFYKGTKKRSVIAAPILLDGGNWPRRLESRSSVSVYMKRPVFIQGFKVKCVYAKTECGHVKKGNSPALRQIVAESREA